jgi:hypothetical protein
VLQSLLRLALLALLLLRVVRHYDPYGAAANPFNSDMGVLIGMARDGYWSPFSLYFYGQDRIGAWPYILCGWIATAAGATVDARWISIVTFVVLVASLALVLRAARLPVVNGLALFCLLVLTGDATLVPYLFDVCHPCAWPLACLLAFTAVQLWLHHDETEGLRPPAFAAGVILATMGVWALRSVMVPMLALPIALYTRTRRARFLAQLLAVLFAVAVEQLLRLAQLECATAAGFAVFQTPIGVDWEFVDLNALAVLRPLCGLAGIGLLIGTAALVRSRDARSPGVLPVLLLVCALLHAVAVGTSGWARLNRASPRYASLSYALLTVAFVAAAARRVGGRALLVLLLAGLLVPLPSHESPRTTELRRQARLLERDYPGAPILGSHWGTYVYPALQAENPLVPLLFEDSYPKTPWNDRELHLDAHVLVSRLDAPPLPSTIRMRGYALRLDRDEAICRWLSQSAMTAARKASKSPEARSCHRTFRWRSCWASRSSWWS